MVIVAQYFKVMSALLGVLLPMLSGCAPSSYETEILQERRKLKEIVPMITPGMSKAEVITIAGLATWEDKFAVNSAMLYYETDVIESDRGKEVFVGFAVGFENGYVVFVKERNSIVR